MNLCGGDFIIANEFVFVINAGVIFIPKMRLLVFLGPTRIYIFLPADMRIFVKALWFYAALYLNVLFLLIALAWNIHKTRINDLTLLSFVSMAIKL